MKLLTDAGVLASWLAFWQFLPSGMGFNTWDFLESDVFYGISWNLMDFLFGGISSMNGDELCFTRDGPCTFACLYFKDQWDQWGFFGTTIKNSLVSAVERMVKKWHNRRFSQPVSCWDSQWWSTGIHRSGDHCEVAKIPGVLEHLVWGNDG